MEQALHHVLGDASAGCGVRDAMAGRGRGCGGPGCGGSGRGGYRCGVGRGIGIRALTRGGVLDVVARRAGIRPLGGRARSAEGGIVSQDILDRNTPTQPRAPDLRRV
jgi:hypothetical protein